MNNLVEICLVGLGVGGNCVSFLFFHSCHILGTGTKTRYWECFKSCHFDGGGGLRGDRSGQTGKKGSIFMAGLDLYKHHVGG